MSCLYSGGGIVFHPATHSYPEKLCGIFRHGMDRCGGRIRGPATGCSMDRIIKSGISLLLVILLVFVSTQLYQGYVESSFRQSLHSTYTFTVSISTDTILEDATFFIPLPVDLNGSSSVVNIVGRNSEGNIPAGWKIGLFGANNATLMKLTAKKISPYDISTFSVEGVSDTVIKTENPLDGGVLIKPIHDLQKADCSGMPGQKSPDSQCYRYLSNIFADYRTTPDAKVLIHTELQGRNKWYVFRQESSSYTNTLSLTLLGNLNHGWFPAKGELIAGIGDSDMPKI